MAYSEQVGSNLQELGRKGDINSLYNLIKKIEMYFMKYILKAY